MTDLKGIVPIRRKFLQPNYLFALQFEEGFLFGRVVRRRIMQYKPYPICDSDGDDVVIAESSHQAELRFRDPRNAANSILYLDGDTSVGFPWFLHGAIGIKPEQVSMYPRHPEGQIIPGKWPNIDPVRPALGDRITDVNTLVSPYEEPTDYVEWVITPRVEVGAEYYNRDADRDHQPVLNLLFACYWVKFFTPARHGSMIANIAGRRVPADYLTVGFGDRPANYEYADNWKVQPLDLDSAETGVSPSATPRVREVFRRGP